MTKILIIDDEETICFAFEQFLSAKGFTPLIAANAEDGLQLVKNETPAVVFLDIRLPMKSGLEVLTEIKQLSPASAVVVMTAFGTMNTAIEAMKKGAYEYLTKPIDLDQANTLIERILRAKDVRAVPPADPSEGSTDQESYTLVGRSQAIQDIYKTIGLMTTNDVTVLIEGESGVGKELVARAIHFNSDRREQPFVAINCGAMPENLLESELFGHEKGSFTGAETQKQGKFEYAGSGTIFLDEIGELKFPLQIKLLRVLQDQEIVRVGGLKSIPVKARVITATNKKLHQEVEQGNFRRDLYYRLQLFTINIPPLKERPEDIPVLVDHFIQKSNRELGKAIAAVETAAMESLLSHHWPGNVRELENVIKRATILSRSETLGEHHLENFRVAQIESDDALSVELVERTVQSWFHNSTESAMYGPGQTFKAMITTMERVLIAEALQRTGNNQVKAAERLGISRSTLRKKMEEYRL
jgi:DNA-binding NtrC family response regulator